MGYVAICHPLTTHQSLQLRIPIYLSHPTISHSLTSTCHAAADAPGPPHVPFAPSSPSSPLRRLDHPPTTADASRSVWPDSVKRKYRLRAT